MRIADLFRGFSSRARRRWMARRMGRAGRRSTWTHAHPRSRTPRFTLHATARAARAVAAVAAALLPPLAGLAPQAAHAQAAPLPRNLPTPCAAAACAGALPFVGSGSVATPVVQGPTMTVTQSSGTALMNWQTFDVAAGHAVNFRHAGNTPFVAINRIHDVQASRIDGTVNAPNGQVYLLNPNGLLFGQGAVVDVGGLIASTLQINERRVNAGLLGDSAARAAFALDGTPGADQAKVRFEAGSVVRAGSVMVFAPTVENAGTLQVTPGGQVVLAAGQRVFLTGSDSATLRGLLVEVGQGGTVQNTGAISTPRGNTTLIGMAVRQDGRINATSALRENGSIRLVAREVASNANAVPSVLSARAENAPFTATFATPTASGAVSLGSGSQTTVSLDSSDSAVAALNDTNALAARSTVTIDGAQVSIGGDTARTTLVQARGGDINVYARSSAGAIVGRDGEVLGNENAAATLRVGADARLDVSGERGVQVDGDRNFVTIERLTSNDLRDAPAQRDGFLRGQQVHLNVAQDHAFIDVSARREAVAGTQAERNASGGTVALRAEGSVEVAEGAQVDIRGGTVLTGVGQGRTSQLITVDGRIVDIANARANEQYVGFADRQVTVLDAPREGLDSVIVTEAPRISTSAATLEGRSAGTLEIIAPRGRFAGQLSGGAEPGPGQRGDNAPLGGELRIGSVAGSAFDLDRQATLSRGHVWLSDDLGRIAAQIPANLQDRLIAVDAGRLVAGGLSRLDVISDGVITSSLPLDLGPRGTISLRGNAVDVGASLRSAGGAITVAERPSANVSDRQALSLIDLGSEAYGRMRFAAGTTLDVAGLFTNDLGLPAGGVAQAPIVRNGGRIAVSGRDVDVSDVAALRVGAGASVSARGAVSGGRAGSIAVSASNTTGQSLDQTDLGRIDLGTGFAERLDGFGFSAGARLSLGAPRILIGAGTAVPSTGTLALDATLFGRGFESFSFNAADALTLSAGTRLAPQVATYAATPALAALADGSTLGTSLQPAVPLPAAQRPVQLTLAAGRPRGVVRLEEGAGIDAGVQGTLTVNAGESIQLAGELRAAGGRVALALNPLSDANLATLTTAQTAQRALQLGTAASIDVSGTARISVDAAGRRSGSVLDGGSVSLDAAQGHLAVAAGARIRADGAQDQIDLPSSSGAQRTEVASRGGSVSLSAMQSLQVAGAIQARAGGAGVEGGRLSVRFEALTNDQRTDITKRPEAVYAASFEADRVLSLGAPAAGLPALGAAFDAATHAGRGRLSDTLLRDSGFDTIWLASRNVVEAAATLEVRAGASVTIDAQALRTAPGAALTVTAPQATLGFDSSGGLYAPNQQAAASGGSGRVVVDARRIDLVGHSTVQGTDRVDLRADDDIATRSSVVQGVRSVGSLTTAGQLTLSAAQVAPSTLNDFTVTVAAGSNGASQLAVQPSGNVPLEPLAAAGRLSLAADDIRIDGRLSAPQGALDVRAGSRLAIGPQAVLSVAGSQAVPVGNVFNGALWSLASDPNQTDRTLADVDGVDLIDKRIDLRAPQIDTAPGAVLDLRAGGDMVAQEFVAGPGGSTDWRANFVPTQPGASTQRRNPVFALIPSRGTQAAPYDPVAYEGLSLDAARGGDGLLRFGQVITIGAGSELPPGTYTVLPPRYAQLPGAYALEPVSGFADLSPLRGLREFNGTAIVAGRLGMDGAGASTARWSGYRVYSRDQFQVRAEWRPFGADRFFAAAAQAAGELAPRTGSDAASLALSGDAVRLGATLRTELQPGTTDGRGATIALSAPRIQVSDQPAALPATPQADLVLDAATLSAWQAETLVLGAHATADANGTLVLDRVADTVRVGGARATQAGSVLLAAQDRVTVAAGATLVVDGTRAGPAAATRRIRVEGDGSALLVSGHTELPAFERQGGSPAGSATTGDLEVAAGAILRGAGVLFDASRSQTYAPGVAVEAGSIGLSAAVMQLGDAPDDAPGLKLNNALLAQFTQADTLVLTSASTFDVHGPVEAGRLGADGQPGLRRLVLDGAGLVQRGQGDAQLTAGSIELRHSGAGEAPAATATTSGSLSLRATGDGDTAGRVSVGPGAFALRGFATSRLQADGRGGAPAGGAEPAAGTLRFSGDSRLSADGDLTLAAQRIGAARAATTTVQAQGLLQTEGPANAGTDALVRSTELGARLDFEGRAVAHGSRIEAPSGQVTLRAVGPGSADGVQLLAGSVIDVAGSVQTFATQQADAPAGQVRLASSAGSLAMQAGSTIDLRGAGTAGDAGRLQLAAAAGTLQWQGVVRAEAGAQARGAEVAVDVGRLADLGRIADASAADPGARWQSADLRVREGNLTLAAGSTLRARTLSLAADGGAAEAPGAAPSSADGRIVVAGTLDADAPADGRDAAGGRIELLARESIELAASARLQARAGATGQEGGSVLLSARVRPDLPNDTPLDAIRAAGGAVIDVSPTSGDRAADLGGTVTLRAPLVHNDVAIAALPAGLGRGARATVVEATLAKAATGDLALDPTGTPTPANPLQTWRDELQSSMNDANRTAVLQRLQAGGAGGTELQVRPGLEITTPGSISVTRPWDFAQQTAGVFDWRYGGSTYADSQPGALTLRAGGNLTLVGGLQDGFVLNGTLNTTSARLLPQAAGDSWRYQLTAGADLAAAAPGQTRAETGGAAPGNLTVRGTTANAVTQVRTGTGRIDLAAAGNIVLSGANVSVFSGGTASVTGPVFENVTVQGLQPTFTRHGGSIRVRAGGDITADAATQLVNNWLWRVGAQTQGDFSGPANAPSAWWVNAATYTQGIGALGGGSLDVAAGGNITSLSTAVPSNAWWDSASGALSQRNLGTLNVSAGGRLAGGVHQAQAGTLTLSADRIGARSAADPLVLAQGPNEARVLSRSDAEVWGSFNPTLATPMAPFASSVGGNATAPSNTAFSTYGPDARLSIASLAGSVILGGSSPFSALGRSIVTNASTLLGRPNNGERLGQILPPRLDLVSFGADVALSGSPAALAPAADGQLRLLADQDIRGGVLSMMDLEPDPRVPEVSSLPTASLPYRLSDLLANARANGSLGSFDLNATVRHRSSDTPLHAGDTQPAALVTRQGDLLGLNLDLPKAAEIRVAGDIGGGTRINVQNVSAEDLTRIHAGGRIDFSGTTGDADLAAVQISGPGAAEILAGRDIDLGASGGIVSRGNLNNANLPAQGAALIVMAGLGRGADTQVRAPDYDAVLQRYVGQDAFAASGSAADGLNAQVLDGLRLRGFDTGVLRAALADRRAATADGSDFARWLGGLDPAGRARLAIALAEQVQAVANAQFVATTNTASFAPGYAVMQDLFGGLTNAASGLRQFLLRNPLAAAANAPALQARAIERMRRDEPARGAVADLLAAGLARPGEVGQAGSAFEQALAALAPEELARASRALLAATQAVAGEELDGLRSAGRVDAGVGTPFAKGLDEMARAFAPADALGGSGVSLVFSQIKSEQDGDLAVLAPRGGVLVGLANPPAGTIEKESFQLGILTLGGGDIFGAVRDSFDVFRSRVFTTAGGDVHLWSSLANIDAGRGPRDVAVAPPPRLVIDDNTGEVTLDVRASVSGSGIGALKTRDDQAPSAIRLVAPNGFIDAGEAGIRAESGTVTLGTTIVLNAGNISAGGGVSGGAVVVAPPAPVPTSSNSAAAEKSVEQTQKALAEQQKDAEERAKKERRKRVTGEFLGFGSD